MTDKSHRENGSPINQKLYEEKLQAKLDGWSAELDQLKAKAREAGADAGLELNDLFDRLGGQINESRSKLNDLIEKGRKKLEKQS